MRCIWSAALAPLTIALPVHAEDLDWLPEPAADIPQSTATSQHFTARQFLELGAGGSRQNGTAQWDWRGNLGWDSYCNFDMGESGVYATVNGRIDLDAEDDRKLREDDASVTLREAYLGQSLDGGLTLDAGRINVRDGVAIGFNPTDVFREGSLLARRTEDPVRLRNSRLGTVGIRMQYQHAASSIAALVAPEINGANDYDWYDPRFDATNTRTNAYLRFTPGQLGGVYSNLVLHRATNGEATLGFNLSDNIGQQGLAYLEFARARREPLLDAGSTMPGDAAWRSQLAGGFSYSTQTRQTLTLEYQYNGAAPGQRQWDALWNSGDATVIRAVFNEVARRQEPQSRHSVLAVLQWDRFLNHDGELQCLVRANLQDNSRFGWCEWRYVRPQAEWSLSISPLQGSVQSEYGAAGQDWVIGARWRSYF